MCDSDENIVISTENEQLVEELLEKYIELSKEQE